MKTSICPKHELVYVDDDEGLYVDVDEVVYAGGDAVSHSSRIWSNHQLDLHKFIIVKNKHYKIVFFIYLKNIVKVEFVFV